MAEKLSEELAVEEPMAPKHRCKDFDEDCDDLDHTHCWLHDPTQGWCPFLTGAALEPRDER